MDGHVFAEVTVNGQAEFTAHGQSRGYERGYGHQRLRFEDNLFDENGGINLLVSGARDVLIKGNRFSHAMRIASDRRADHAIEPNAVVYAERCQDVTFDGNVVIGNTTQAANLFKLGPATDNVTGLENGLVTAPEK